MKMDWLTLTSSTLSSKSSVLKSCENPGDAPDKRSHAHVKRARRQWMTRMTRSCMSAVCYPFTWLGLGLACGLTYKKKRKIYKKIVIIRSSSTPVATTLFYVKKTGAKEISRKRNNWKGKPQLKDVKEKSQLIKKNLF